MIQALLTVRYVIRVIVLINATYFGNKKWENKKDYVPSLQTRHPLLISVHIQHVQKSSRHGRWLDGTLFRVMALTHSNAKVQRLIKCCVWLSEVLGAVSSTQWQYNTAGYRHSGIILNLSTCTLKEGDWSPQFPPLAAPVGTGS